MIEEPTIPTPPEDITPPETYIPITTGSFDDFTRAVTARMLAHLSDLELEESYLNQLATQFAYRFDGIFQKYRAGQIEHGGDIRDRDLLREVNAEVDDLLVYTTILTTCLPPSVPVRI